MLLLLAAGVIVLAAGGGLQGWWPPVAACASAECKEGREWIAFAITTFAIAAGLYQYRRAQQWKRAEFLANEMRTFLSAPAVRNALLMVDWGARYLDLLDGSDQAPRRRTLVTREMQARALIPHRIVDPLAGSDRVGATENGRKGDLRTYTVEEAAIRDCYDALLDGLERFSSYVETGLVSEPDLRPYLGYWIDDIAATTKDQLDGEWNCLLLTYIDFYGFYGVQRLFASFGHDIRPQSALFRRFLGQVRDKSLLQEIKALVGLADG